jgi:hypothetical protein
MMPNNGAKRIAWNQKVSTVPAKYGVAHIYEDQIADNWKKNYDNYMAAIR